MHWKLNNLDFIVMDVTNTSRCTSIHLPRRKVRLRLLQLNILLINIIFRVYLLILLRLVYFLSFY